jgi:flagellar motor protein MotB
MPLLCPDRTKTKVSPAKHFPIPNFADSFRRVALLERGTRVGRSQGASIFWGLISTCFAAAACFYYWENHKNEVSANQWRDTVLQLRDENETLTSEKEHLQASKTESETELKTREDLVQQKETELAAEEARIEGMGQQTQVQSQQNQAQAGVVKKFNDLIRKLGKDTPPDVVERGGRPVLRVPNAQLFAPGDTALKPEGKALLTQIAQALSGQIDNFELRVVTYTDTEAEASDAAKKDPDAKPAPATPDARSNPSASWDLTAARAIAIERFLRDQSSMPFLNVLVMARGDAEPIASNSKENHARNRRVEITVTPLPVSFHAPDPDKANASATSASSASPDDATPAPKKDKPKVKKANKDSTTPTTNAPAAKPPTPPTTRTH